MGKDKNMKVSKSEKRKKKKDKENESLIKSPKKKNIYQSEDEESDDDVRSVDYEKKHKKLSAVMETPSPKKKHKTDEDSPAFGSSKKKSKHDDPFSVHDGAKKKSKKDKEILEDENEHKIKSKKDKESNQKKKAYDDSPSKHSKKHLSILQPDIDEDSDISDHEELKSGEKENEVVAEPDIVTSDKHIEEEMGWPKEDFITLLENMSKTIPEKDNLKYTSRVERLQWAQITFKDHTPEECKEKWKLIEKKIRGFRILREMVEDARLWVEKPWSSFYNSNKKNRHPDLPRRPLTSYMLFYMQKKSKFSKKHPGLGLTELSKIVADKFHNLPESKKQKYVEQAKALREEYKEKMQKFFDTHPNESMVVKKKLRHEKMEMPGPKRPLPPVKLFIEDKMKKYDESDGLSKAEFMAQIKETWKNLSSKKKVHWIRWAHENEKKYLEELEVYKSENTSFEMPKIKPLLSKEEVTILERMEGKPEKPPNSAYSLFSRLMLKDDQIKLGKFSPKERMKEISRLWSAVSDEEKKQYQEKAKRLLEDYKLEYAMYLESLPEDKRAEELVKNQSRKRKKKEQEDKGKKLKQTKIVDSFRKIDDKKEEEIQKSASSDEDDEEHSEEEQETDIMKNPQKLKEIKNKIQALDPPKPSLGAFELFKEIYLTNPGNKESRARLIWESMPKKEKERYMKKLERQKQEYILKYKDFLAKLKPHEIKVYSIMKNESSAQLSDSSEEESDDEADDSTDEDNNHQARNVTAKKTESTSSSSEESD